MAQMGKASMAHEYENGMCIHCGMYKTNVDRLIHVCKPWREQEVDAREARRLGYEENIQAYRKGLPLGE